MDNKMHPRIKILVACHKADPNIRHDDIYMPIQVGKALHPELDSDSSVTTLATTSLRKTVPTANSPPSTGHGKTSRMSTISVSAITVVTSTSPKIILH